MDLKDWRIDQKYIILIVRKSINLTFGFVLHTKILIIMISILLLFVFIPHIYAKGIHQESLYNTINNPFVIDKNYHIDVGKNSSSIDLHYNGSNSVDFVYVANYLDSTISVISTNNNSKIKDIPVGDGPVAFAVYGNYVYVANSKNNSVTDYYSKTYSISVISTNNNSKIKDIPVGDGPVAMTVGYDGNVYVANYLDSTISVISTNNNSKIKDIPVGDGPVAFAVYGNYVYVANYLNNSVSVIDSDSLEKIDDLPVGKGPKSMTVDGEYGVVYVANYLNNSISEIYEEGGNSVSEIPIGKGPIAIMVVQDSGDNNVYVANYLNNSVSVINGSSFTKIKDIPVGKGPKSIIVDNNYTVYVANYLNNSVSVVDGITIEKVKDIPVGDGPVAMVIDASNSANAIYLVNSNSNSVSLIDNIDLKVVGRFSFNISPLNSGYIKCNELTVPTSTYFYIWSDSNCIAHPNKGFEFSNWQENLNGNSTKQITISSSPTALDSILDAIGLKYVKPEAILNTTTFGSYTANFKPLPPPIPAEYTATLFSVIITAFIGSWLTPTVITWRKTRNQGKRLDFYHNELTNLIKDNQLDKDDIGSLNYLRNTVTDEYTRGKINKEQFDKLIEDISISYRKIFDNELNSIDDLPDNIKENQLSKIMMDLEDTYNMKKINDEQFISLRNQISILYEIMFKKKIDSLKFHGKDFIDKLKEIEDHVEATFSKGNINQMHYDLLHEKISEYTKKQTKDL